MINFFTHDHALIRGLLIGAVVLASATACSRSDRTETGSNNTGTVTADTATLEGQNNAVTQSAGDTATAVNPDTASSVAPAAAPRAKTATTPRAETSNQDTATAGYRGMERDTGSAEAAAPRDTARVTTDSAATPSEQSSVTPSDSAPMEVATPTTGDTAVGTTDVAVQEDTAAIEVAVPADSSVEMAGAAGQDSVADSAAGYSEMATDTSMTEQSDTTMAAGQVDVAAQTDPDSASNVDAAVASSDTAVRVGDSAHVARTGDRLEPVVASAEVNDSLTQPEGTPVRPPEDSTAVPEDRETVAAADAQTGNAERDEVGAAAIGGNVNGADAVALMTRQGAQCIVVDPESAQGVAMDMSETPATLNPCGLGSMVPSRIWTQKE